MMQRCTCKTIKIQSMQEFIFNHETYHFFFRQPRIEKPTPTATITKMMMMTMTAVKIIRTELLRTVIDVGTSVYVVTVALFTVEMDVAKAVLKGDELLRTVIDVEASVYVVTVALFTMEMGVAKAVLKGNELLCTVIDVGASVYVITVASLTVTVEMGVAKAVLKGAEVWVDMYSRELTNVMAVGLSDWLIPGPMSAVLVISGVKITLLV